MNQTKRLASKIGFVLCGALLGYTTYGQPSVSVGVSVPVPAVAVRLPSVEIHVESDFYEPLTPHGEWVVIGSYGRCWRPGNVARDWRPYCNGNWQRTDAGWYWVSDEPWAWATYHYGRWDFNDRYGWYWVPQTQWAPAWVSWHEGGGYVGWAPLQPSVSVSVSGFVGFNQSRVSPRAFVFVEQRRFLEPIRPTVVVVNNTTIINKTVNITNIKVVNNTIINEGPPTAVIEKASGQKVQAVPVHELRHKTEAAVIGKAPVRNEAEPREKKAVAAPASSQVEKPATVTPAPKNNEVQSENHKPVPSAPESKTEIKPDGNHPAANTQPAEPKPDQHVGRQEKSVRPSGKKAQRPVKQNPVSSEKNGANPADKGQEKNPKNND